MRRSYSRFARARRPIRGALDAGRAAGARPARPSPSPSARVAALPTLILLRHGQSQWNLEDRFTGWVDVDLTAEGEAQAKQGRRADRGRRAWPSTAATPRC